MNSGVMHPIKEKLGKNAKMAAWVNMQLPEKLSTKRKSTEIGSKYKHPGGIERDFPSRQES